MKPKNHKYSNQCYADGGEVSRKTTKKKTSQVRTDRQGNVQSNSVGSTTDTLRNRRKAQMEAMGLKDGGRVMPPKASVRMPQPPPPKKGPKPKRIGGGRRGS